MANLHRRFTIYILVLTTVWVTLTKHLIHSFASGTLQQVSSYSGLFIKYCQRLYLTTITVPPINCFSFLLLKMRKANIGYEHWCSRLFCVLITVSLREQRSMECTKGFPLSMFPMKNTITKARQTDTNPIFCFLTIASWNTNRGWFNS